ncbi:MAG TPA: hypothetical protein P5556_09415 [Candidatus Gastranaerophilales bacterium]|nr:hypothetical protein [Candidatus Gastranaerophilales bacterium]
MNDFINIYLKRYKTDYAGNAQALSASGINYSDNKSGTTSPISREANNAPNPYPDVKFMYSTISSNLDKESNILLNQLYKKGELFDRSSNDGSSTLENFYKIVTKPRLAYFDKRNIVKETLKTLNDPYIITQNREDFTKISHGSLINIVKTENKKLQEKIKTASKNHGINPDDIGDKYPIKPEELLNIHGSTCPAASIEFNLADRRPAEFARYVEGLTSPEKSVKTKIKYSDLSPDITESLNALIEQHSDFKPLNWDNIEVTVRPDENAYLNANIQQNHRAKNTRSMVDVLLQSAFMQLGSRGTYNTLTDKRSKEVGGGAGLNQFEIAFVESIVDSDSKKMPIIYMELNDDLTKVLKYNYDFKTTKKHLVNSLDMGKNIITGFLTDVEKNGNIATPQGHEVLLTGYRYDEKGKLWLKYNDTDDGDYFQPSWTDADEFIPKIHHANIPRDVLQEKPNYPGIGYLYLQDYKNLKNGNKKMPS